MNKYQNSLYPNDWKETARKDWERVKRNLKADDLGAAAFFFQQSLEKYLKAFLLGRNWELRKVHSLTALLDYAIEHMPELEEFRSLCERATDYYIIERYPKLVAAGLNLQDIEENLKLAQRFIQTMFPEEK